MAKYTHVDGESGNAIVRMTLEQAECCSRPGAMDDRVRETIPNVEWLGSAEVVRRSLRGYGAWDSDELADDDANRARALWIAACDIAERPGDYAD